MNSQDVIRDQYQYVKSDHKVAMFHISVLHFGHCDSKGCKLHCGALGPAKKVLDLLSISPSMDKKLRAALCEDGENDTDKACKVMTETENKQCEGPFAGDSVIAEELDSVEKENDPDCEGGRDDSELENWASLHTTITEASDKKDEQFLSSKIAEISQDIESNRPDYEAMAEHLVKTQGLTPEEAASEAVLNHRSMMGNMDFASGSGGPSEASNARASPHLGYAMMLATFS